MDVATGDNEYLGEVGVDWEESSTAVYSLQIDGGGRFWVMATDLPQQGEAPGGDAHLWSFTLDTADEPVYSGIFDDAPYYTQALLIIPGDPVLPATGAGTGIAPIAAGVLLLRAARSSRPTASAAAPPWTRKKSNQPSLRACAMTRNTTRSNSKCTVST